MTDFLGYPRSDGTVGVRNHVLLLPTVICANAVVERIDREDPGAHALVTHQHGCGQVGADHELTVHTLQGVATSPNVGAVVLVSLGCETNDPDVIADFVADSGRPVEVVSIQREGGVTAAYERASALASDFRNDLDRLQREPADVSELVVGLECGGSDAWSGLTANPALGRATDRLVAEGGTAILSETPELVGAEHLLAERAASPEIARTLLQSVAAWEKFSDRTGVDARGAQPSPGNQRGGLTTIEEKSLGAVTKGGTSPVTEVVAIADRPKEKGLVFMDTPSDDIGQATAMAAGGAQIVCFTTGRGTPTGSPIVPVIKISSNTEMAELLAEHIDIDAGRIVSNSVSLEDMGDEIFRSIVDVASGQVTTAERGLHREFALNRLWSTF